MRATRTPSTQRRDRNMTTKDRKRNLGGPSMVRLTTPPPGWPSSNTSTSRARDQSLLVLAAPSGRRIGAVAAEHHVTQTCYKHVRRRKALFPRLHTRKLTRASTDEEPFWNDPGRCNRDPAATELLRSKPIFNARPSHARTAELEALPGCPTAKTISTSGRPTGASGA